MRYNKLFFLIILSSLVTIIKAQENNDSTKIIINRKVGVYKSYQDFLKNIPIAEKSIKIVHVKAAFKPENLKLTYEFVDSTPIIREAWGVFDGKKVYYNTGNDKYLPMSYLGKYSFYIYKDYSKIKATSPIYVLIRTGNTDDLSTLFNNSIMFYNEKGKLKKANNQSIGWLIRKEKDFLNEYNKELFLDNNVFKKYLIKMNERYPLGFQY